jgi:hypothetical protein
MDLVVPPESLDSQLVLYVTTMSGTAVFKPDISSPESEQIKMKQHQTLVFNTYSEKIIRQSMSKNIVNYWESKIDRTGRGPILMLDPANISNVEARFTRPATEYTGRAVYLKTRFLLAGVLSVLGGVALQSVSHFGGDIFPGDIADYLFYGGYAPLGVGAFLLFSAYFY